MNMITNQPDLPLDDPRLITLTPADVGFDSSWCDPSHATYGLKNKWTLKRYENHGSLVCRVPRIARLLLVANYAFFRDGIEGLNADEKIKRQWTTKLHRSFAVACNALNLGDYGSPVNFRHSPEVRILRNSLGRDMPRLFNDDLEYNGCTVREWSENEIRETLGLKPLEVTPVEPGTPSPIEPSPLEVFKTRMIRMIESEFDQFIRSQNDEH